MYRPADYETGGDMERCVIPLVYTSLAAASVDVALSGNAALIPLALPSAATPSPLLLSCSSLSPTAVPSHLALVFPCLVPVFPPLAPT